MPRRVLARTCRFRHRRTELCTIIQFLIADTIDGVEQFCIYVVRSIIINVLIIITPNGEKIVSWFIALERVVSRRPDAFWPCRSRCIIYLSDMLPHSNWPVNHINILWTQPSTVAYHTPLFVSILHWLFAGLVWKGS